MAEILGLEIAREIDARRHPLRADDDTVSALADCMLIEGANLLPLAPIFAMAAGGGHLLTRTTYPAVEAPTQDGWVFTFRFMHNSS